MIKVRLQVVTMVKMGNHYVYGNPDDKGLHKSNMKVREPERSS